MHCAATSYFFLDVIGSRFSSVGYSETPPSAAALAAHQTNIAVFKTLGSPFVLLALNDRSLGNSVFWLALFLNSAF